ncbi:hypothetical protein I316_06668 [Kwoniella heveanensis BCC8398]|uniref:DNA (cytosine-5-)-methyltransferase n=1 Tax=Kwoniella heveanensis BCC8398 TaxID=1296120 RepID=A0A1B9GL16_9TREE|nr:hypothetical protein I316_06668 [Kwoniella heveanensis BCC8398]
MSDPRRSSRPSTSLGKRMRALSVISVISEEDEEESAGADTSKRDSKARSSEQALPPSPTDRVKRARSDTSRVAKAPIKATETPSTTPWTSTSNQTHHSRVTGRSDNRAVWSTDRNPIHPGEEVAVKVDGVDDAIRLSSAPYDLILIRSIYTLKFHDSGIPSKSYVHAQYLDKPTSIDGRSARSYRQGELFLKHANCQDFALKLIIEGTKLDFELIKSSATRRRDTKHFAQFVDEWTASTIRVPSPALDFHGCDACHSRDKKQYAEVVTIEKDAVRVGEERYHLFDFVFIDPGVQGAPYMIGHLISWTEKKGSVEVNLRMMERIQEVPGMSAYVSERHLVASHKHLFFPATRIVGTAFVFGSEDALRKGAPGCKSAFWCTHRLIENDRGREVSLPLQTPLKSCSSCLNLQCHYRHDIKSCLEAARFPAADCYSGAGGFLLPGLDIFDWQSACDIDVVACETLRRLKPKVPKLKIHHGSVEELLHRSLDRDAHDTSSRRFPARGSTFLLTGGPPCQGHSRASHANNNTNGENSSKAGPTDDRNSEMFVFLALVAHTLPYVVILENVGAFKDDKAELSQENADGNFARRAMRELTSMGSVQLMLSSLQTLLTDSTYRVARRYAVRLAVINSRAYGSPQDRHRCFILAVQRGLPLPELPAPTHAVPSPMATVFKDKNGRAMPFYLGDRRATRGTGIHPPVTISDAISDLPVFEYHSRGTDQRPRRPIFSGSRDPAKGNGTKCGFAKPVAYASPPLNDFQRAKRGSNTQVNDHYTSYCTPGALDIIFNRSKLPNARGCERRAVSNEGFSTLLTNSAPGGKSTAVIHPSQERKFTTAERKRAMGWPDCFKLAGTPLDQDRLTGNGVCFESVEAIYQSIVETIILPWWIKAGKPKERVYEKFVADYPIL